MYFTVAAIAAILMMSFNMNANMNSNMNAYATIMSEIPNVDDIGQSAECVIVVVGCDGTGSVGSSGDTIIGSFNGNDDNNTNGDEPIGPLDPVVCGDCIAALTLLQSQALAVALGLDDEASFAEICLAIEAITVAELVEILTSSVGLTLPEALDFVACINGEIPPPDV